MGVGNDGKVNKENNNDEDNPFRRQTLGQLWMDFRTSTTMHGLGRATGSQLVIKRIIWSLVVLGSTLYGVINLISVYHDYVSYPVSTTIRETFEPSMSFPAVTLCNINRIKKSMAPPYFLAGLNEAQLNFTLDLEDIDLGTKIFLQLLINDDQRRLLGHSLDDMLVSCSFHGDVCTTRSFTETYSLDYGNCFVFNRDGNLSSQIPGANNGLVMELNIQEDEYLFTTPSAGVKVAVHPPKQDAFPDEEGTMLTPGFLTRIGLKKLNTIRSPPPYGQCIDVKEANLNSKLNMYYKAHGTSYSDKTCRRTCYQTEVYSRCSCCDLGYPCDPDSLQKDAGLPVIEDGLTNAYCNITPGNDNDYILFECLRNVQKDYLKGSFPCLDQCKPPCEEIIYADRISMSKWPRDIYYTKVIQRIQQANSSNYNFNADKTRDFVEKNMMRVEIFYESFTYQTFITSPAYDWGRVVSDVGGQLGLWLGFSLITAMEWLEFLLDVLIFLCRKLFGKKLTKRVQAFK